MRTVFDSYAADEPIPVQQFIKNRKLVKYFNRETAAALVAAGKLLADTPFDPDIPFYYESGVMEFESLGLDSIADGSRDEQGRFNQQHFVEIGTKAVPPLTQFKALYNMPLSFVAIEHGLVGDNAVIYGSAGGLLMQAQCAPGNGDILLGCGKVYADARVECGFALIRRDELTTLAPAHFSLGEAIELLRDWHAGQQSGDAI